MKLTLMAHEALVSQRARDATGITIRHHWNNEVGMAYTLAGRIKEAEVSGKGVAR